MRVPIALGLLALATLAESQENIFRPLPGAKQVGVIGNWSSSGGTASYSLTLEGGWYVTESLVAIARVGFEKHSPARRSYFVGGRYELPAHGASVPYIVAGVEFHQDDRRQTGFITDPDAGPRATIYEAGLGMNWFVNTHSALFVEVAGFKANGSATGVDTILGLRVFFK